jgi:SAM-dependent MidA family methyltransferase
LRVVDLLEDLIRERGPLTVAAFMEVALYDPGCGYYARAARRSGRAGDFFTSVDVGPTFGELLEIQIAEMAAILAGPKTCATTPAVAGQDFSPAFDLVEAGAGNGRLAADILRAARRRDPLLRDRTRLHLVEASGSARAAQRGTLGDDADRLVSSSDSLPPAFEGVLIANELLDALPIHQVIMREDGLREVYVDRAGNRFVTHEGPVSSPALNGHLEALGIALEPGWRAEINLRAPAWIREVARRLRRGFVILIDYGHDAGELYSPTHASGTLTTFTRHTMAGPESSADTPAWLVNPGEQDITAHVDFTSVRAAAEAEGLTTLGFLDQTYFLLGLIDALGSSNRLNPLNLLNLKDRLALKTLLMPGGLGSTHKVLILSKGVGSPPLRGCSYRMRVT